MKYIVCILLSSLLAFPVNNAAAQLIPFCQKGKWGFADTSGRIRIPCTYQEVAFFSDDNLARVKQNGKYGFINNNGKVIIPFDYMIAHRLYDVYHEAYSMGIKHNPEIHLNRDIDFDEIRNNRYIVAKDGLYGVLRLNGDTLNVMIPFQYSKIQFDPAKKLFHCTEGNNKVYINMTGQILSPETAAAIKENEYSTVPEEAPRQAPRLISSNDKWGVVAPDWYDSRKTDTIVPPVYDEIIPKEFSPHFNSVYDLIAVRSGKQWGMLNGSKQLVLPIGYDSIHHRLSRMRHWLPMQFIFVVKKGNKWGLLGKKGPGDKELVTLVPFSYNAVSNVYGYLLFRSTNKWQIYDAEKNQFISNNTYTTVSSYEHDSVNGFYLFQVRNKAGQTVFVGENGVEFFAD